MSAAAGGMLCCAVCCTVGCLFNVVANARVTELEAKLRRAKRSHRRQLRRQRLPAGNDALRRVSSAAARRTAQVVADNVRQALLAAGCEDDWEAAFEHMDRNGFGDLTPAEFRAGIRTLTGKGLSDAELDELMYEVDRDGNQRINYFEFIEALRAATDARTLAEDVTEELRRDLRHHRDSLQNAFDAMDINKDGLLTMDEFRRGLRGRGISLTETDIKLLMRIIDADGDGVIDYVEFINAIGQCGQPRKRRRAVSKRTGFRVDSRGCNIM